MPKSNRPQNLQTIPIESYLRLNKIIGSNGLVSISRSKFYQDIKKGIYPPPIKLGRVSVWRASEIYAAIESAANNVEAK